MKVFTTFAVVRALACMAALAAVLTTAVSARAADDRVISVEINKGALVKLGRAASSVVIADPATADIEMVSPKLVVVRGKKIGQTSLYAVDAQDNPILNAVVSVTYILSSLQQTVKSVVPDASVSFRTVDGGLVMEGFADSVADSEKIRTIAQSFIGASDKMVDMIQTAGSDQVMLKVRFVEMARNDLKNLGVNMQNAFSSGVGGLALQVVQGPNIGINNATNNFETLNAGATPVDRTGLLDRGSSQNTGILARWHGGQMTSMIDALETQGLATILAEPTLTTTSGKAASFLAGGQFPVPVVGQNGQTTIQYQPFGVSLKFTPVVMSHDRISMTVAPEVSTLDFNNPIQVSGITYPILDTRSAAAVVELGSGSSFMLAGLLQNDGSNTINKFPGLGDLPVLGALFRSTSFQNNETELVILVTPYIVHPVADASKLQTPLDGFRPPSDLQLLLMGNLFQQQPLKAPDKAPPAAMPPLYGDGGFIME
ncbi:MAG: type II and III secretion system protein family protein [Pseudomonadota bacterium]|nr:type II and III secretion system protein family protein [Pseudomonadota bacterium]